MAISGKTALITGGASGIGLALVKQLLQNGAKGVAIVDISETNGLEAVAEVSKIFGKGRVVFIKTDVTQETELIEAFDKTVETFQNLDIVINNAGICDEVNWEKSFNVLLVATIRGTYLAMQKYLPKYKSGDEGLIVNTSSFLGLDLSNLVAMYSISKRGVIALGETLGTPDYYNRYKSKILTICPGVVDTPFLRPSKDKLLFPERVEEELYAERVFQTPEWVAQKYVDIMGKAQNGSIWVVDENKPEYQVEFPKAENMRK